MDLFSGRKNFCQKTCRNWMFWKVYTHSLSFLKAARALPCTFNIRSRARDWRFSTLPLPLSWINQRRIALQAGGSLPYVHYYSGFAFGQPNDALCFILHCHHPTNCSKCNAHYKWKCISHALEVWVKNVGTRVKKSNGLNRSQLIHCLYSISFHTKSLRFEPRTIFDDSVYCTFVTAGGVGKLQHTQRENTRITLT